MDDNNWGELSYEGCDWNDITDAEFSGDQEAIEKLINQSQELRRQNSISDTPKSSAPTTPCYISTPNEPMSFSELYNNENRDTNIVNSAPPIKQPQHHLVETPFSSRTHMKRTQSYAQITRGAGKVGKRRVNERIGLSPCDLPRTKSFRRLLSPPPLFPGLQTTPDHLPITMELSEINLGMDTSTPESDRLTRGGGVQRRLFGGQTSSPQNQVVKKGEIGVPPPWHVKPDEDKLVDFHRLAQRQKQIDMGKETVGYERYMQTIPKWKRGRSHPWTPDKYKMCSTRAWQGQMKTWRRNLHKYDPPIETAHSVSSSHSSSQENQQFTTEDAVLCEISLEVDESPIDL